MTTRPKETPRSQELDREISRCDREIASLKQHPDKNGINHDVMLVEWKKNRQVFIDEKRKMEQS